MCAGAPLPVATARCYGAEHIVECLKVPCPNTANGCSAKLARYAQSAHLQVCKYRPFQCPAEDCTFADRYLWELKDHLKNTHKWPLTNVYDGTSNLALVDGFNVIMPCPGSGPQQTETRWGDVWISVYHNMLILKVTRESYGRVVTPVHIRARGAKEYRLKLAYETPCGTHRLEYAFNVPSTDVSASGRLPPSLDDRFNFVVPKSVQPLDMDTIKVAFSCWYLDDV
jgi:E3 ubiquitin-protein ligase SIAH1